MIRSIVAACIAGSIAASSFAAPQIWSVAISEGDVAASVWFSSPDGSGGTFVVGATSGDLAAPHQGAMDFFAARISPVGNLLWVRQFGTSEWDYPGGVSADGSGGCFFTFSTKGAFAGPNPNFTSELVLGRLDGSGTVSWVKQFDSNTQEWDFRVVADGSGGAFVAGTTAGAFAGPAFGDPDAWLMRVDGNGSPMWMRQFGGADDDWVHDLVLDGAGGVYLSGGTLGGIDGSYIPGHNAFLVRFDGSGNTLWALHDGLGSVVDIDRMVADGSDGVFVVGRAGGTFAGPSLGAQDVWVGHYTAAGVRDWTRKFGGSLNDSPGAITLDGLGGVFAVGWTDSAIAGPSFGLADIWVAQFRGDGTMAWIEQIGSSAHDHAHGASASTPGRFVLAGSSSGDLFGMQAGESHAFAALLEGCAFSAPQAYCPGVPNSTGAPAVLANQGSTSIGLNDLRFTVSGGPPSEKGIVIVGTQQNQLPFGNGTLCLGGSVQRLLPPVTLSAEGKGIHPVDFEDPTQPTAQITPGSTWYFQFWYRDSAAGVGDFNLSNGLSATFCP